MKIKGVNLGNWLVLEKWMSPYLYEGTDAADEYYLAYSLPKDVYEARIMVHRNEYITERDFAKISSMGLNSVRIPVPYFIFGDCPPFIGCIEYLDKAFSWAQKYNISVLIDLHTVPGSQNGFDNGGISGVCVWSQTPEYVEFTLTVLERLAERYKDHPALMGIEIVNEPITEPMWSVMNVQERYVPVDKELGAKSKANELPFLKDFYIRAYHLIRKHLPEDKAVVIHDAFNFKVWKDFMREEEFKNVILDTHIYYMMAEVAGCEQTLEGYVKYAEDVFAKDIAEMQEYFPIICGEWSLFNSLGCGIDTRGGISPVIGLEDTERSTFSEEDLKTLYTALSNAQIKAWEQGIGYYYWNYKLLLDIANEPAWAGWDSWDLGKAYDLGWFPKQ